MVNNKLMLSLLLRGNRFSPLLKKLQQMTKVLHVLTIYQRAFLYRLRIQMWIVSPAILMGVFKEHHESVVFVMQVVQQ